MYAAWRYLVLALLLGISLAAVLEMKRECRDEPGYVRTVSGGHVRTVSGGYARTVSGDRQCQLVFGDFKIPLPWQNLF